MSLLRIDEIFNFEKGVLQSSKCVPGEYDFITASSDWKTHNEYTHECEALIFAAAASGSLGRTHYVNGRFISSDLCFIITPKDQEKLPVDLKFYHILFNELKDEIVRNTKAGTSKEAIGLGSFGKYLLPYFDIDTQIEIKNRFVNSEELKSNLSNELNHQLTLVKKLRQQLLQDAVQGKLVPQNPNDEPASELFKKIKAENEKLIAGKKIKKDKELPPIRPDEIPFEIPENWVWCRLGEISDIKRGKSPVYAETGIAKMLNQKCVRWYELDLEHSKIISEIWYKTVSDDFKVKENDILVNSTGEGTIGRSAIASNLANDYVFDSHILKISSKINQQSICYFLNSNFGQSLVEKSKGATSTKQTELGVTNLSNFIFPLPPLTEQNRIVQKLDELLQYCNELEASIKESESQNEKLQQQVLREALRKEPVEI